MNRFATAIAYFSGLLFLLLAIYMSIDVTSRYLGGPFTGVADQFASFCLALGGTWSLARALGDGSHVRIDVFMPLYGASVKKALYVWSLLMVLTLALVLSWQAWIVVEKSAARGASVPQSMIDIPLAIPQALTAIGYSILALQAVVMIVAAIAEWIQGSGNLQHALEGAQHEDRAL